jgi:acetyl-CoA synthetase
MHIAGAGYDEVMRSFRWELPHHFNIAEAICEQHARRAPDATALIYEAADGSVRQWSFAKISTAANRCANVLAAFGVGRGTVVGIHLAQCPETLIAHVAIQKLGAIALPLFNLFGPDAIGYRLADSGARVLITTPEALARTEQVVRANDTPLKVITVGARFPGDRQEFWHLLAAAADTAATAATGAEDPALLIYTSGTTGNPKGALHAQRVLIGHLPGVVMPHDFFPQPGDRFWTPADWAWVGGLLDVLFASLYFGVPVVAAQRAKFDPEWAFAFLARHGVRNTFMPPTALRLMQQVPEPRARHAFQLRSVGTGGER